MDQPTEIRSGEELNNEKLSAYLESVNSNWDGALEVKQFPSGFSNLTYWLKKGEHEFVLRKPPFGASAKGGHDMSREYNILSKLYPVFPKVPKVYHFTNDESILGSPFYLMERLHGDILRKKKGNISLSLSQNDYQKVASSWLKTFVELHQIDIGAAELGAFGKPVGYNERQIKGWSQRYFKAKTSEVSEIEAVIKWLNDKIPEDLPASIIHNDYKYDNIVYTDKNWEQVSGVLDWEMATIGNPLMDLGTSIAYWVNVDDPEAEQQQALLTTYLDGNPKREELIHEYALASSREVDNFIYYYVYGLFKITVIVQQIFYRYKKGYTTDKRFEFLDQTARFLCLKALQSIQKKRIDNLF